MTFFEPVDFREAIDSFEVKAILPTEFRSEELLTVPPQLRERAFFLARVRNAELLDFWHTLIGQELSGHLSVPDIRINIKRALDGMGYEPPLGEAGGMLDLSSDTRINLVNFMQRGFAKGAGQYAIRQSKPILDGWPVDEFRRIASREEPRPANFWPNRWAAAGGKFYGGGRMMARVDSPVWRAVSHFGLPYHPFHYNSGYGRRAVDRETAESLGVIEPGETPEPEELHFNESLKSTPEVRSQALRDALEASGAGAFDEDGVLRANTRRAN